MEEPGGAEKRAVTLADVARRADVSMQTVSRVVNNHPRVAARTRARVNAAVAELNYVPNRLAAGLARQRTYTVGFATNDLALHAPSQLTSAIERAARAAGYSLIVSMIPGPGPAPVAPTLRALRERQVDGLLINASLSSAEAAELSRRLPDLPHVFMDVPPAAPVPAALLDQYHGAQQAARHLLGLGHTRIACLHAPGVAVAEDARRQGWTDALRGHGLRPAAEAEGDWSPASGYAAALQLLAGGVPFTALLVANDQMAVGALRALWERGLHVPRDLSVVGFDDTPESALLIPPLSTVRQDFPALGQRAFGLLHAHMTAADPPPQVLTRPQLVLRASTGPPPSPDRLRLREALGIIQQQLTAP